MQSTEIYSDSSCESPVSLTIISNSSCTSTDCSAATVGSVTYYTKTSCPSDRYDHTATVFNSNDYLLMDIYSGTTCTTYIETVAAAASGNCEVASIDGQGVIATLNSNGSATMQYYVDSSCSISSSVSYTLTLDEVSSHSCFQSRIFYSSYGGSSGVGSSSSASNSSSSGSELGTGVIAGIIVGCAFLVALVGVCLYRRRKRKSKRKDHSSDDFARTNDLREAFYEAQRSPGKNRSLTTTMSHSTARDSTKLWEDDVIIGSRIPREKVILKKLINRGGFGEVYLGSYNGNRVAVKMLLPETKRSMTQVTAFLSEVKLMAGLDHPRIVSFIGVAWDQLIDVCVISEYMGGGDLNALLVKYHNEDHPVGFDYDKIRIALHVSIALTYLHSCAPPVIHRDLKSKNILLDENMNAKVTDFGISRERVDKTMTGGIGTSFWMAPEVMMGERYDDKADMFSFGVVLSELDSHVLPYSNATASSTGSSLEPQNKLPSAAILQMVASGKLRVHFSDAGPRSMIELGLDCVSLDPNQRPSAAEALYKLQTVLRELEASQ